LCIHFATFGAFLQSLLPVILGHTPAGASSQTVLHYLQGVKSAKFQQYDEGTPAGNIRKYGSPEPPEYDLSRVKVPIYLHYSLNDFLASKQVRIVLNLKFRPLKRASDFKRTLTSWPKS
jgi:hypothetical protein